MSGRRQWASRTGGCYSGTLLEIKDDRVCTGLPAEPSLYVVPVCRPWVGWAG